MTKSKKKPMSHQELCERAGIWLRTKCNCGVAFVEHKMSHSTEIPDALGFRDYGRTSILVEVKVQRGDFLGDKKKSHRANPDIGIGDYRFYCAPKGLIKVEELPERWGLIEWNGRGMSLTHVPDNITSLKGIDVLRETIAYGKTSETYTNKGKLPRWVQQEIDVSKDFLFHTKDEVAEKGLLYAAMRMWFISSEANVNTKLNEKYWVNPMKGNRGGNDSRSIRNS